VIFHDREEAGRLLAAKLEAYRDDPSGIILALPRGGVAIGYELSLALHLPLDIFITRKLGPSISIRMPSRRFTFHVPSSTPWSELRGRRFPGANDSTGMDCRSSKSRDGP